MIGRYDKLIVLPYSLDLIFYNQQSVNMDAAPSNSVSDNPTGIIVEYSTNEIGEGDIVCRLRRGDEHVVFSLGVQIDPDDFNVPFSEVSWQKTVLGTLEKLFQSPIAYQWLGEKDELPEFSALMREICKDGLATAGSTAFNMMRVFQPKMVDQYRMFVAAFEEHTGILGSDCQISIDIDMWQLLFKTPSGEMFVVSTYASLTNWLSYLLDQASLDEMYVETHLSYWEEIASDPGMVDNEFLPNLIRLWQLHWDSQETQPNLPQKRSASWRQVLKLVRNFKRAQNPITYAEKLDSEILSPLAIRAMVMTYNRATCIDEYLELEFEGEGSEWESVVLTPAGTPVDMDDPDYDDERAHQKLRFFYIKRHEW